MDPADRDGPHAPLLHPLFLGALAVLLVNDHILKAAWPGLITGKLSDVAGLIVVPPVLAVAARRVLRHRIAGDGPWLAGPAALFVALAFSAVKLHPGPNEAYGVVMGLALWPGTALAELARDVPVSAPTVARTALDAGDLVALPAVVLGWWIAGRGGAAASARARNARAASRDRLRRLGRAAVLLLAVFAIAATSLPQIREVTAVARDEVLFENPEQVIERRAIVDLEDPESADSITIEARSRWPYVEPAPMFRISVDGRAWSPVAETSSVALDPATCGDPCRLPVAIAVSWPGAGAQERTSVAWELVVTAWSTPDRSFPSRDLLGVVGEGFTDRQHGLAPWVALLLAIVLTTIVLAASDIPRPVQRRGMQRLEDLIVLIAAATIGGVLIAGSLLVDVSSLEPGAGGTSVVVEFLGVTAGAAVLGGTMLWLRGSGGPLAVALLAVAVVGYPFAARLIGEASATFAASGLVASTVLTVPLALALAGALRRRGTNGDETVTWSRVVVGAVGLATAVALIVASAIDATGADLAFAFGVGHIVGVALWWVGSGWVLGVSSFLIGGGTVLRALVGAGGLFGGPWTGWDLLTIAGVAVGAWITILAAAGAYANHPSAPARRGDRASSPEATEDTPIA